MTEYLLKKQGEGSLQAAVSGYGKLEIQSKTQNDLGQIDRLDLLKKFVRTNFLALAVAHNKPRSLEPVPGPSAPLGVSYGQLQAERKFPTSRCKRLWKT